MTTIESTTDSQHATDQAPRPRRGWRDVVAALRWLWLRSAGLVRALTRKRRARRDQQVGRVLTSEVLVSFPDAAWSPALVERAADAADPGERSPRRWQVETPETLGGRDDGRSGRERRKFVRVECRPGYEREVLRTIKLASWREGVRVGRGGLLAIRSAVVVPTTAGIPLGPIEFTQHYAEMKLKCGVGWERSSAERVRVLIVDADVPDRQRLQERGVTVSVVSGSNDRVGGHSTMVAAIVGDIAKNAEISAIGLGGPGEKPSTWGLMNAIERHADADIIVAPLAFVDAADAAETRDRSDFVDGYLRRVTGGNVSLPLLVFPTGNHPHDDEKHQCDIAIPGRSEAALTIGAIDPTGTRSAGSRYGPKYGRDPDRWWLAPGGSFGGAQAEIALVTIGGSSDFGFGTSVATAFAGGVIAVALGVQRSMAADQEADGNVYQQMLMQTPQQDPAYPVLRQLAQQVAGGASPTVLLRKLEQMADTTSVLNYRARTHGKGLLCLTDALLQTTANGERERAVVSHAGLSNEAQLAFTSRPSDFRPSTW